jgi:hypothetical protein
MKKWKNWLKGILDSDREDQKILVTGLENPFPRFRRFNWSEICPKVLRRNQESEFFPRANGWRKWTFESEIGPFEFN